MVIDLEAKRAQVRNAQYIDELESLSSLISGFTVSIMKYKHFSITQELTLTLVMSNIIIDKRIEELHHEETPKIIEATDPG